MTVRAPEEVFQLPSKSPVHTGVDERVRNVVEEVRVEDNQWSVNDLERYQPSRKKGADEHQGHCKQHGGRLDVVNMQTL